MLFAVQAGRSGLRAALFALLLFYTALGQSADLVAKSARVRELMEAGRFAEAVPLSAELVKALPSNTGLKLNLALALHMSGKSRESIPYFEQVLKAQPDSFPAALSLGSAHLEQNEPNRAIPPLTAAVRLDPKHVPARGMLAAALFAVGRPRDAAKHYLRLAALAPEDPKAWRGLGRCYEEMAEQAYKELSKAGEASAEWLSLVADSRLTRGQHRSAFFFYKEALARDPNFRPAHEGLVSVYRAADHPDWAAAAEAKQKSLPAVNCVRDKAACEFRAGRFANAASSVSPYWRARAYNELAREAFAKLGGLPPSVELHSIKAEIASGQGRHMQAAEEWRNALKLAPHDVPIQQALAAELHDAGDYAGALEALSQLNPKFSPEIAFLTGDSYLLSEKPEQAIPHLETALEMDPKLRPARASLGRAYMRIGNTAKALPHLEASLALDDDGSLHYQLARALQSSGDSDRAKTMMAEYQRLRSKSEAEKQNLEEKAQITAP